MAELPAVQKRREIFDKIQAVFILTESGICLFNYAPQPKKLRTDEQKLEMIGNLLSAINLFAKEVGGGEVNHLKLEGATFYCLKQKFKTLTLLFASLTDPKLPPEKAELFLKDIASLFTLNFGQIFEKGWKGNVSIFSNFNRLIFFRWGGLIDIMNNFAQILKVETVALLSLSSEIDYIWTSLDQDQEKHSEIKEMIKNIPSLLRQHKIELPPKKVLDTYFDKFHTYLYQLPKDHVLALISEDTIDDNSNDHRLQNFKRLALTLGEVLDEVEI